LPSISMNVGWIMASFPWGWAFSAAETLPVGETGGSKGMGAAGEGDHPACTSRNNAKARKVRDTPAAAARLARFTLPRARG
jgi:hypothetical protein